MNTIVIVGGDKLVYFLTRAFISNGSEVTIINKNREECTLLARQLKATVIHGDGSDPFILEEAGIATADTIIAVTPNDQDNLVICQIASLRFRVPRTLALVNDPDNEEIFRKLGVSAFSTTRIISNLIEQRAGFEEITNLIPAGEGSVTLTEFILKEPSPVIGLTLRDIPLPEHSLISYIIREGKPVVPRGNTVLHAEDRLIIISEPEHYGRVLAVLTGEK